MLSCIGRASARSAPFDVTAVYHWLYTKFDYKIQQSIALHLSSYLAVGKASVAENQREISRYTDKNRRLVSPISITLVS